MATLLLRLAGPLQSWGTGSSFETRRAGTEPSKSGVIGMLAAALGRARDESLADLNCLQFGVRVDQEGKIRRDFQTVKRVVSKSKEDTYLTYRDYLEDAVFVVGLASENKEWLQTLADAVQAPRFSLYLGRRACPPDYPVFMNVVDEGLEDALRNAPWQASEWMKARTDGMARILLDSADGTGAQIKDLAVSFHPVHRQYNWRNVVNGGYIKLKADSIPEHDPMAELE